MLPRMIIVEDTDSRIQYTGPWFADKGSQDSLGVFGPPFRSTLHGTQANASLEFAYHGGAVQVYGTGNIYRDSGTIHNDSGVIDPTWECFLDGILIDASHSVPDVNNWLFCGQPTVSDGQHILTVDVTVVGNQTFWFDDIHYVPSAGAPLDQEFILVDKTDPQLQYGQGWQDSYTNTTGSILTFDFIGVSISWYGSTNLLGIPSSATYSIDGQTPIDFILKGKIDFNQKLFETAQLSAGPHTLKVVYQGNNSTPLNLDYLVVQNGTLPLAATSATTRNGLSSSTSTPGKGFMRVGAIVGGLIGGLALIFLGLLLLRRYRRRAAEEKFLRSTPWPFYFEYTTSHPSSTTPNYSFPPPQSAEIIRKRSLPPVPPSRPSPLPLRSGAERKAQALAASQSQRRGNTMPATVASATRSPNVIVHEDSGIRMPESTPATNETMEVPPLYTVE